MENTKKFSYNINIKDEELKKLLEYYRSFEELNLTLTRDLWDEIYEYCSLHSISMKDLASYLSEMQNKKD